MNILYLEDNPNDADLVSRYIQSVGHQVALVSKVDEVWNIIPHSDLLIADILIDGERVGVDVVRYLRDQGYQQPMIALTALNSADETDACFEAGFDSVVNKPFTIDRLAGVLQQFLR